MDKKLFGSFNSQLRDAGMILEKGSIVDASIEEAYTTHRSKREQDARFTSRGKKPYH